MSYLQIQIIHCLWAINCDVLPIRCVVSVLLAWHCVCVMILIFIFKFVYLIILAL